MKEQALAFCNKNAGPHKRIDGNDFMFIHQYMKSKGAKSDVTDLYRLFKSGKTSKLVDTVIEHFESEFNFIKVYKERKFIGYASIETKNQETVSEEEQREESEGTSKPEDTKVGDGEEVR